MSPNSTLKMFESTQCQIADLEDVVGGRLLRVGRNFVFREVVVGLEPTLKRIFEARRDQSVPDLREKSLMSLT